jgi:hypothetical protein
MEISKLSNYKNLGNYTYFESNDDEYIYYSSNLNILFKKDKNILYNSNINLTANPKYLKTCNDFINNVNFENDNFYILENIIYIQT